MSGTFVEILAGLIVLILSGLFIWRQGRRSGEFEEALKAEKEKIDAFIEQREAEREAAEQAEVAKDAGSRADGPAPLSGGMSDATFRAIFGYDRPGQRPADQ